MLRRREALGARAPGDARVGLAQCRLERGAPAARARTARRACRRRRSSASRWMPDGRGEHGHVAGERLEHGQAEALALGGHEHGVGGVDPQRHALGLDAAERQQLDADGARERERAVVALLRARGIGGEQQVRPLGVEAQLGARLRARRAAGSARGRRRTAAPARARARARPGSSCASDARHGREQVDQRQHRARSSSRVRGWRRSVPCTVSARTRAGTASAGQAVRPKCACTTSNARGCGAARPRRRACAVAPAQIDARRARARARRAGTRSSSTSSPSSVRSAATWSRTKRAALGMGGVGEHVGDHQRAQDRLDRSALE